MGRNFEILSHEETIFSLHGGRRILEEWKDEPIFSIIGLP